MTHDNTEHTLKKHGVNPTAVRILVWETVRNESETFALNDVERWLPTLDRSSIFRALRLFEEHSLLHGVDDGSGQQKYCVCRCESEKGHVSHVHFTCQRCGKTYCLEDHAIPLVDLPEGFSMAEVEYIVKGVCPNCV